MIDNNQTNYLGYIGKNLNIVPLSSKKRGLISQLRENKARMMREMSSQVESQNKIEIEKKINQCIRYVYGPQRQFKRETMFINHFLSPKSELGNSIQSSRIQDKEEMVPS
jgi:hypothetical protein